MSNNKKESIAHGSEAINILKNLDKTISERKSFLNSLDIEIKNKQEKINNIYEDVDNEISQKTKKANDEIQEKTAKADKLLKDVEKKVKTIEIREQESLSIEQQIKELDNKSTGLKSAEKEFETEKTFCYEMANKAKLIVEQYNNKLAELSKVPEEKAQEEPVKENKE